MFDKIKDLAGEHADKVGDAIDKVAGVVDEKTGGKYSEHIGTGVEKAKEFVGDATEPDGPTPPGA
jgi:hypothetical protein